MAHPKHFLTARGETLTVPQWCRKIVNQYPERIYRRLAAGWTVDDALFLTKEEGYIRGASAIRGRPQSQEHRNKLGEVRRNLIKNETPEQKLARSTKRIETWQRKDANKRAKSYQEAQGAKSMLPEPANNGVLTAEKAWELFRDNWTTLAIAHRYNLSQSVVARRLRRSGPYDFEMKTRRAAMLKSQIETMKRNRIAKSITITLNGETKTIKEWSKITGKNNSSIRHRIRSGWTPEEILLDEITRYTTITWNGVTRKLSDWEEHTGISYESMRRHLREGWSANRIFGMGKRLSGRPKLAPDKIQQVRELLENGHLRVDQIAELVGTSISTIYRHFPAGKSAMR